MRVIIIAIGSFLLLGCSKKHEIPDTTSKINYSNVLILGNSITYAPSNTSIGWNGSWGMAASAPQNDFVHLLTNKLQQKNSSAIVSAKNIAEFETGFSTYDFDSNLKSYRDSKPDLIIIRIGENVQVGFDQVTFEKRYVDLLNYLKVNNPKVKIFTAGSFWPGKDAVDAIMKKYSPFISLSVLGSDVSNYSFGLYADSGIQQHPCDKGMKAISDMIWNNLP